MQNGFDWFMVPDPNTGRNVRTIVRHIEALEATAEIQMLKAAVPLDQRRDRCTQSARRTRSDDPSTLSPGSSGGGDRKPLASGLVRVLEGGHAQFGEHVVDVTGAMPIADANHRHG